MKRPLGARDQRGFGLLEIMVTMGLFGIMALAITSLTSSLTKTGKSSDQNLALSILMSAVQSNLGDRDSCQSVFRDVMFDLSPSGPLVQNLDAITLQSPSTGAIITIADVGTSYSGLLLESIVLERSAAPINATPIPSGATTYDLYPYKLRLQLKRDTKQSYGEPTLTKEFSGLLSLNTAGGDVLACTGASFDPQQICTAMGGTWDAAASPKCDLGAAAPGSTCGFYFQTNRFAGNTPMQWPCKGTFLPQNGSCPSGYTPQCWGHGGTYAVDRQCTCVKN